MLKEFDVGFVAVIYVQTGAGGVGRHIFFFFLVALDWCQSAFQLQ